ncbi:Predicted arabinose efflux permease, MFS family [Franzmannia pantelleriensis]|uniref:Predicted arabinose efflux permease, MFS family n=1 Tax=Franzmannia pantelleriensis TaxID=48727 RepID=A0A1G9R2B8_9GAMM|nr:MFS transporter [Halomonas pantelleriensis]SDM17281.1 Predicted arabinose efflux permease, MFS family [Halomonas pantelleriensis]
MSSAHAADPPAAEQIALHRQPGFVSFLVSRLAAVFAMQIQAVVVAWQVYAITRDPMSLAYVGLAQFLPMVVLLLPAGDLVDRFPRKRILQLSWGVQALCSAMLLALSLAASERVGAFYAVLALFGCARAFTGPALQSLLPNIVPRAQLAQAIALNSAIMKIAVIGGPMLGGILYALGGGSLAYATCLGCFAIALAALLPVPIRFSEAATSLEATAWRRFTAGIGYIRRQPIILGAISLDLFAVLLGGVVALLPIYAQEVLHVGPEGLGALRSAIAVGALLMGIYLGVRGIKRHAGMVMFVAVAIFGVANLVFAFSTLFWLSLLAMLVAGAADMISVYVRMTVIQLATPDEMRGRVNAVNMLFIGSSNELGEFRAGSMAAWLGAVPAAVIGGLGTLAVVGAWMRLFPTLRRVDRFDDASH